LQRSRREKGSLSCRRRGRTTGKDPRNVQCGEPPQNGWEHRSKSQKSKKHCPQDRPPNWARRNRQEGTRRKTRGSEEKSRTDNGKRPQRKMRGSDLSPRPNSGEYGNGSAHHQLSRNDWPPQEGAAHHLRLNLLTSRSVRNLMRGVKVAAVGKGRPKHRSGCKAGITPSLGPGLIIPGNHKRPTAERLKGV